MSTYRLIDRLRIPTYDNEAYVTLARVSIDHTRCNGCGLCTQICPGSALVLEGTGKERKAVMDKVNPQCMSCNDCAAICNQDAIKVITPYDYGYRFKTLDRGDLITPRIFTEQKGDT
jgi:MinD superfamily P-loop ATPase